MHFILCHSYLTNMPLIWNPYITRMYPYVTCMYWYVICMSLYVIRMSLVCIRMSLIVCISYVVLDGQIDLIKFIESNKFDNAYSKIGHIFV